MKTDYKNWMPKGMISGFATAAIVSWVVFWIINNFSIITVQPARRIVSSILLVLWIFLLVMTIWMFFMHRAFSYNDNT